MLQAVVRFITLPRFLAAVLPVPLSAYARRLGRRDGDSSPGRNEAAVSTGVLLMIVGALLKDGAIGQYVPYNWLLGSLGLLFVSIDHDRRNSWVWNTEGKATETKAWWRGIIIPDLVALLVFLVYLISESKP